MKVTEQQKKEIEKELRKSFARLGYKAMIKKTPKDKLKEWRSKGGKRRKKN